MHFLDTTTASLRGVALLVGLVIVFGLSLGVGLTATGVLASHDDDDSIHACVNPNSGNVRIVPQGSAPDCKASEVLLEWHSLAATLELQARVSALENQVPECLSTEGGDAVFEGCNVYVQSGSGSTSGAVNGTGNVIIGYNESNGDVRSGSHNLVIGPEHSHSSYGGLVVGRDNTISGPFASVSGGTDNTAAGPWSSVSGGFENTATGGGAVVSGGERNTANFSASSVSGGSDNTAANSHASVSGGSGNTAEGRWSSISGGRNNTVTDSGWYSTVSGGIGNTASGFYSSVAGGAQGSVTDDYDTLVGNELFPDVFIVP